MQCIRDLYHLQYDMSGRWEEIRITKRDRSNVKPAREIFNHTPTQEKIHQEKGEIESSGEIYIHTNTI